MRVILFGATGMVGQAVLRECLLDPGVSEVVAVGRQAPEVKHAKLLCIARQDLMDLSGLEEELRGFDACFWCLGVSVAGRSEAEYRRLTHELTVSVARFLLPRNPGLCFVYVSGQATDGTERGPVMWARVKGATENAILRMGFRDAYAFRPGVIRPMHGEVSKTGWYRWFYVVGRPLLGVARRLAPQFVITTEELGRAMIRVAREGWKTKVLESRDLAACGSGDHS